MRILAGDVGGTNTRLALFEVEGGRTERIVEEKFASRAHRGLDEIVLAFVSRHGLRFDEACFGVAGPVKDGRSVTSNLPWVVETRKLQAELSSREIWLINDLEANAWGIESLADDDFLVLSPGKVATQGNAVLISAGTGLGEAGLYWDGTMLRPLASEGGHSDFGPRTGLDVALYRFLAARYGHVSWERVLSGPGLVNLYEFLREFRGAPEVPAWLADEMRAGDPAPAISRAALSGRCPICTEALDLFVRYYGAEAGNLALKIMAVGGVFVGGGIAPKIARKLEEPAFLEAFRDKGRMRPFLEAMPVRVILNDRAALLGAARYAALAARTG